MQELCVREPDNLAYRRELSVALSNVGRVLENKGDNAEAAGCSGKPTDSRRLVRAGAGQPSTPPGVRHRGRKRWSGVRKEGDHAGALELFQETRQIRDDLSSASRTTSAPTRVGHRVNNVGRVLEKKGDHGSGRLFQKKPTD
ncbi:MAG: hypothetical protein R3C05_28345 [Pirellulaceae bacterium]